MSQFTISHDYMKALSFMVMQVLKQKKKKKKRIVFRKAKLNKARQIEIPNKLIHVELDSISHCTR
jgi:hypothetical protein